MPKVFISHSWEDNEISRQIAEYLKRDGAEIWIDYARIKGGQSLPQRISEALEWCDTLILFWSQAAKSSYYVNLEWENALDLRKNIIPCLLDGVERPAILRRCLFVDFRNSETGYQELARALNLTIKKEVSKTESVPERKPPTHPIQKHQSSESKRSSMPEIQIFRTRPQELSEKHVQTMLKKYDFYCHKYDWNKDFCNPDGRGFKHQYQSQTILGDNVVIDQASGLMWQQGGSSNYMNFEAAKKWIDDLKQYGYAGFRDWRLPTLEEVMSLMENAKKNGDLYIDPVFDQTQSWIWTADPVVGSAAQWVVYFGYGSCDPGYGLDSSYYYVRAVRSGQSSQD